MKIYFVGIALIFANVSGIFAQKTQFYEKIGSSSFFSRDVSASDSSFGGAYSQFSASFSSDLVRFAAKSKLKLSSAQTFDELSTSATWEKSWGALSLPILPKLWIYGGKGFVFALSGSFFSILDSDYADVARFGKDGLGVLFEGTAIKAGFATGISTTTSSKLSEKFNFGTGINVNLKEFSLPLEIGASLIYDNAKNFETKTQTETDYGKVFSDVRDFSSCVCVKFSPSKDSSFSLLYAINAEPIVNDSIFKRVEGAGSPEFSALKHSHVGTFLAKTNAFDTKFDVNAEIARSFDDGLFSIFGAISAKKQIFEIDSWKFFANPDVRFYKIGGADSFSRQSLVLRPIFSLEFARHIFKFGVQIERREVNENVFHWQISVPAYYKFSL